MVLTTDEYDAAYFGDVIESGGLRHDAGYSNYLEQVKKTRFLESNPDRKFNPTAEMIKKLLDLENIKSSSIVELGGAVGDLAQSMLADGFNWTVVDVADWCDRNKIIPAQNFVLSDALTYLQKQSNNSIGTIVSVRFMDCLADVDVQILIDEMRRTTNNQIHFIDELPNPLFYNIKPLEQWRDNFNWPANKVNLVSFETLRILRF